jgi:4'-phosphopantetheinyl transferase
LLALGLDAHLGVDVESMETERDVANLARLVFSASQYGSFLALPVAVRKKAFLEVWTRREAVVKALGGGLSIPLDSDEVEGARAPEWSIQNIEVDGQYVAALAVRARRIEPLLQIFNSRLM